MLINNSLLDISLEILRFDQLENENWVTVRINLQFATRAENNIYVRC